MDIRRYLYQLLFCAILPYSLVGYRRMKVINSGVIMRESVFHDRQYRSAFNTPSIEMNRKLIRKYRTRLFGVIKMMKDYSPSDIVDAMCRSFLPKNVSVVMFFAGDEEGAQPSSLQYLAQVTQVLGLPIISFSGTYTGFKQPIKNSNIIQMAPSVGNQAEAMLSFLQRYNWKSFSIITGAWPGQDNFINSLKHLTERQSQRFTILSVIKIFKTDPVYIKKQLQRLSKDTRIFLFYASKQEAIDIFKVAKTLKLLQKDYVWLVSKSVVGKLENEVHSAFPVGLMGVYYPTTIDDILMAIKAGSSVWATAMYNLQKDIKDNKQHLSGINMYPNQTCEKNDDQYWPWGQTVFEYMTKVKVEVEHIMQTKEKKIMKVEFNTDGTQKDMPLKIINLAKSHKWEEIGEWTSGGGIHIDDITWPGGNLYPPDGRPAKYKLKVVTLKEKPYVIYDDPDPKTGKCQLQQRLCRVASLNETLGVSNATTNSSLYKCVSGFCIDLLTILSNKIGFDFELFQVEDKKWGAYVSEKKEWNGLVRTLMDEKADMCMTSLKITPERNRQVDFSVPFLETGITIIVAVRDGVISPTAFLEPFDILSWIFILLLCIQLMALAVFMFEWISPDGYDLHRLPPKEPYDYPSWCLILVFSVHASGAATFIFEWLSPEGLDQGAKPIREHRFSLFRSFWLIWAMLFGAAVNVDSPRFPKASFPTRCYDVITCRGAASRFLTIIWALFAVVFTASYTANLAAFMITKEDFDRLTGIQDWRLLRPKAHKPPFKFATVPHGSTETNVKNNFPEMYKYMKKYKKATVDEGAKAVKEGDINAFIYDATVLEYMAGHDDGCKLRTVGNWYAMTGYGVAFPRGSRWKEEINKHLLKLQYDGELERLQHFWLSGACTQSSEAGETSMPLGILNFTSAFILLAAGMLLGGMLLLFEHIYFKFFRVKLRKWDKCGCCSLVSLSMGKSLTFEQSVREAMELTRNFKCKNPVCETQLWKTRHELDLALLKVDRLQRSLSCVVLREAGLRNRRHETTNC